MLANERAYDITVDDAFVASLDEASTRAYWRSTGEELPAPARRWRPFLTFAKDFAPKRTGDRGDAEEIGDAKAGPMPEEVLDFVADYALPYRDAGRPRPNTPPPCATAAGPDSTNCSPSTKPTAARTGADMEARTSPATRPRRWPGSTSSVAACNSPPSNWTSGSPACVKQGQYVDLVRGEGEQSWKFKGAATPHEAVRGLPGYSPPGRSAA